MSDRFYLSVPLSIPLTDSTLTLDGSEAHHLIHVLRAKPGQRVELFDGEGREASAEVRTVARRTAELHVVELREIPPSTEPPLTIAAAVPKGDRARFLVEKLTELGVARLVLLDTERSVVAPRDHKLEKLRQTVIAACKQSGRSRLMEIAPPIPVAEFCHHEFATVDEAPMPLVMIAHPGGAPIGEIPKTASRVAPRVAMVGPEGGFTEAELNCATQAGAQRIGLGAHILRIETAAIALASLTNCCLASHTKPTDGRPSA